MFGMLEGIYAFLQRMIGTRNDTANATGSLHAKTADVRNSIGTDADVASATGTVHAKLKDLKTSVGLKSVQRGSFLMGTNQQNVTISSVNMSKAFVNFSINTLQQGSSTSTQTNWDSLTLSAHLSTSTNLQFNRLGTSYDPNVYWEVIEFY